MIPDYPYFGLPNYMQYINPNSYAHSLNSNIYNNSAVHNYHRNANSCNKNFNTNQINHKFNYQKKSSANLPNYSGDSINSSNPHHSTSNSSSKEFPLLTLLGINLYFDDVLLICIIFFLYNEKVNDPYLFFSLILLLLS